MALSCVDHTFSIVSWLDNMIGKQKPFKLFNMCVFSEDFRDIVVDNWRSWIDGTMLFALKHKLKQLNPFFRSLNHKKCGHISTRGEGAKKSWKICRILSLTMGLCIMNIKKLAEKQNYFWKQNIFFWPRNRNVRSLSRVIDALSSSMTSSSVIISGIQLLPYNPWMVLLSLITKILEVSL